MQVACENLQDREVLITQAHRGGGCQRGGGQDPFEAAQQRCALVSSLSRREAVDELTVAERRQRWDEVVLVAVLVGEAENRVVASIGTCDDGTGRSQVDPQVDVRYRLGVGARAGKGPAVDAVQAVRGVRCHAVTLS